MNLSGVVESPVLLVAFWIIILISSIISFFNSNKIHQKFFQGYIVTNFIFLIISTFINVENIIMTVLVLSYLVISLILLTLSIIFYLKDKRNKKQSLGCENRG